MIADAVQQQVVTLSHGGEILLRVIDDAIGAEGADQVDISGAADAGDFRAEGFGDLHGEGADAAGGAIDEDLLARLEAPLVAKRLQGGEARDERPTLPVQR